MWWSPHHWWRRRSPHVVATSLALGGRAPSVDWRPDLEPTRPDLSLLLKLGPWLPMGGGARGLWGWGLPWVWWLPHHRWRRPRRLSVVKPPRSARGSILSLPGQIYPFSCLAGGCLFRVEGHVVGGSLVKAMPTCWLTANTCGRRSYLIEGVVLGISHTLCCRGRLGLLRVSPRGCPAGLVRRWPVEGGNSRRPRGVASVVAVPATLSMALVITVVLLGLQRKLCLDSSRRAAMTFQRRFSFLKA